MTDTLGAAGTTAMLRAGGLLTMPAAPVRVAAPAGVFCRHNLGPTGTNYNDLVLILSYTD